MKITYKILFNRDKHNNKVQSQISKIKDYLNNTLKHSNHPYFIDIGFVGGSGCEDEQTSFNLTLYIANDLDARMSLNDVILSTFKGLQIYIFENDSPPYLFPPIAIFAKPSS
jgi:hypothetical protein|tara:strand:- start:265 stop:600 length:336 start_codon:yes stop_codon:yes gene_type:complete